MSTFIIALRDGHSPSWGHLPPVVTLEDVTYRIHRDLYVEINGEEILSNFDICIDFGLTANEVISSYLPNRYIHLPRLSRTEQMATIRKFNKDTSYKLLTPTHYITSNANYSSDYGIPLTGVPGKSVEKVMIKRQLGSRGENQVVLPIHLLSSFMIRGMDLTQEKLLAAFPDILMSPVSDKDEKIFPLLRDMFVCEYIDKQQAEFRILVSGDKLYGRKRQIHTDGEYPQVGDRFEIQSPLAYTKLHETFKEYDNCEEYINTIEAFVNHTDFRFGSIDIYLTDEDELGIFEYSNEFGSHRENPAFLRELHVNALDYITRAKMDTTDFTFD